MQLKAMQLATYHSPRRAAPPPRQVRVNTISAGPLGSRAAKAIGFIDDMIRYSYANAPMQKELAATVRSAPHSLLACRLPPAWND